LAKVCLDPYHPVDVKDLNKELEELQGEVATIESEIALMCARMTIQIGLLKMLVAEYNEIKTEVEKLLNK
jgi:hypothetical protein